MLSSLLALPSWDAAWVILFYFGYLAIAGKMLPGKVVAGAILSDGTRLHYRCNGLLSLLALIILLGISIVMKLMLPTIIVDLGGEVLSTTLLLTVLISSILYAVGRKSCEKGSSLAPHVTGSTIHDCIWGALEIQEGLHHNLIFFPFSYGKLVDLIQMLDLELQCYDFNSKRWYGVQLNPHILGTDLKFFFVRAGMMGWLLINLSVLAKSILEDKLSLSMILYQTYCLLYVLDYFLYEEFMTTTWDIIAERLGFMLVFGDLAWIPFTFSIQARWLLKNEVNLTTAAAVVNTLVFMIGYLVFRGSNKQKHVFKKDPMAHIWGKPPKVIGRRLLASGYWGIARHCNYLGDLLLAFSFSLPCGARFTNPRPAISGSDPASSSLIPYCYPIYLLVLLIWRERRDEARCRKKYKEYWVEYCRLVPWRILPYIY